jgi:hypothetical protein
VCFAYHFPGRHQLFQILEVVLVKIFKGGRDSEDREPLVLVFSVKIYCFGYPVEEAAWAVDLENLN